MEASSSALPNTIYAQISPRSVGGTSIFEAEEPITAGNVAQFASSDEVVRDAVRQLRRAGFRVLHQSAELIDIAGSPEQYERFFRTRLYVRDVPVLKPGNREDVAQVVDTVDNSNPGYLDTSRSPGAELFEGGAIEEVRYPMQNAIPPDPAYWHLDVPDDVSRLLDADPVHLSGWTGRGVGLVMVDTGWFEHPWFEHPWFAAHGFQGHVELGPGTSDPARDTYGHGTGESANAFSVAPGIDFTMVKMNLANATGAFTTAAGLQPRPDVISCSWSSSVRDGPLSASDQALAVAVAAAVAAGIVVVFSAGNGGGGSPVSTPT